MDNNSVEIIENTSLTAFTINDLYSRFIDYLDVSPKTIETYSKAIKQFMKWLSTKGITSPTREHVLAFKKELQDNHKATTVQNYIIALRQFFSWTATEGLYPNISDNIKGAKISKDHKKDALTTNQVKEVISSIATDTLKGKRDYAIFVLMLTGGLRTIEVERANIEDIRTVADQTVLFIQGKGREDKTDYIKLSAPVEKAIREYLNARGRADNKAPLFAGTSNRSQDSRITTRSISRIVKDSLVEAGYNSDRLTAHSLRHTAATLNLMNGGTLEETQQLLRHSQINTTMIYLHHMSRINNNSEMRIAEAIF